MIKELKLVNFRNFSEKIISNFEIENFIIGENGKGKTNILEAISQLGNNSITKLNLDDLVKMGEDYFFIEVKDDNENKYSFYYSKKDKKRNFLINNKKSTKKEFHQNTHSCVIFSPIMMNMIYLSPSLRRDFLDDTLKSSYSEYENLLKNYRKILKNRNSILKAIHEKRVSEKEIEFWDKKFIDVSSEIYNYRFKFINFLQESIVNTKEYFAGKVEKIEFIYKTKIDKENIAQSIKEYLEKNFKRDIILGKTHIGPHVDDFEIKTDDLSLIHFASRGETKSIIIYLKLLEGIFIEKKTNRKPILIIDDLLSELDENHKDMLLKKINYYQTFISNIYMQDNTFYIKL
ncbi:MAG: DNA replication and repair protein RecF [Candidatus Gracilibacteria bacterium]|nr:DNA replication and repair protein RecF [Candidatus Gracilibacteria bacterium]